MALKKVDKVKPLFSVEDIGRMGKEYAELSKQIKELEEQKKILAERIKSGAESFGVKDDKGSFYLENDNFIMGKVAKKSIKINQDKANLILTKMGLDDVLDTITTVVVNEDRLEQAVADNRITLEKIGEFTDTTVSYSVTVKEKEAMPVVEVSTVKASKRK